MEKIRFIKRYFTGKTLILVMALLLPQLANAYDFMVDGIAYNYNNDGTTVTVTSGGDLIAGDVIIPENVTYNDNTYSVTSIGEEAFCHCYNLTSVTIPSSVTSIGKGAFSECYRMTDVTIPNSVTLIDNDAFNGCSSLTSITIPNSVTTIGNNAFRGCLGLTSVTIPNSVTTIGEEAFSWCSGLTEVTIPNSVTSIGDGAFSYCEVLPSVTIPNSVTSIGDYAFSCCSGLTSVTIPNSVTTIGEEAFSGCLGLTSVTIPNSVTSIGNGAFAGCSGLTSVTIPNSVTSIGDYTFSTCMSLTSITIPSSVTTIGNYTFSNCMSLTSIIVESGNTKYDSRDNCNAIIETATNTLISGCKNTVIPNSVTSIGNSAFYGCSGLTSVTIPNSVTLIGNGAFDGCSGLTSVTIPNSVTEIGNAAFYGCSGLTEVTIPNSVTTIGQSAFYDCSGLTSITIPNSVTEIGDYTFSNCMSLTSITIPSSVTCIGKGAFSGCSGLISITLTGQGGWYYNSSRHKGLASIINQLKIVNIGNGITSLGNFGFTPDVVNCYAETPPTCSSGTFANYDGELHVPTTSIASYFMADYWQNFNNMINNLSKVALDKTDANVTLWESLSLTATVTPAGDEVIWSSTNPWVATVDENGVVTATGGGECDIYATLASSHDAAYAICHITVSHADIIISLSDESLEMNMGDEHTLTATITPDNGEITPTWSSNNTGVATVDENGKVTAIGEGECDITAAVLDQTATCHVTVTNNVTISLNLDNAIVGASQMLTVYPSCTPDVPVELVVTSSDPSVAVARVVNRTNAPSVGLKFFPEKGMALALMEELSAPSESKVPELASTKAIMIVGVQNGTATITVTTADGKATSAVLELRVVDVDGDRTVTASDITAIYSYLLAGDNTFIDTSDVNGDGSITSADITVIYNLILGN